VEFGLFTLIHSVSITEKKFSPLLELIAPHRMGRKSMSDLIFEKIAIRKERWSQFYDPATQSARLYWIECLPGLGTRPWPNPYNLDARIEWAWEKYQLQLKKLAWLDDDSLPFLDVSSGTEIFAEAFGCRVHHSNTDMPFALPLINSASEAANLHIPTLDTPSLTRVFTIARELRRRAGSQALLRMPDIQSPMDITALIWDKSTFFTALIEESYAVEELADKVKTLLVAFLEQWFGEFGSDFVAHYPDYYVPHGITLSEDEIGSISSKMFQRHFLPELTELSEHFGGIGIHCCANARHQWENFKKIPGLFLLNLNQPAEVLAKGYEVFKNHTAQLHINNGEGDPIWTPPNQLPTDSRVVYNISAETPEQAVEILAKLRSS
jgi:hypothetical protein